MAREPDPARQLLWTAAVRVLIMKMIWRMFAGTAIAACLLCVSNAKAAVLLDWQNGALGGGTPVTGVTGSPTITYVLSASGQPNKMDDLSITITLNATPGYDVAGLTAQFTLAALNNLTSITVNGQTFGAGGGTSTAISLPNVSGGGSQGLTLLLSGAAGSPGQHSVTFSDIQFSGTVTAVPEPVNIALGLSAFCAVAIGMGRRVCRRMRA